MKPMRTNAGAYALGTLQRLAVAPPKPPPVKKI